MRTFCSGMFNSFATVPRVLKGPWGPRPDSCLVAFDVCNRARRTDHSMHLKGPTIACLVGLLRLTESGVQIALVDGLLGAHGLIVFQVGKEIVGARGQLGRRL